MPAKISTADTIIELCEGFGVSIFLDGSDESDIARIGSAYSYDPNEKILTIYLINLRPNAWEKLKPYLKEKWAKIGMAFDTEKEAALESVIDYTNNDPHADVIELFNGKISAQDLTILKLAFFLRDEKENGNSIDQFKQDIWEKFGERGAYISSLCNSRYFENEFLDAVKNKSEADFKSYYDLMVDKELKAIFVHSRLRAADFRDRFEDVLIKSRRYRIPSFRIHGFGSQNVTFIKTFFQSYRNDEDGFWGEFSITSIEEAQFPPSLIYEIILIEPAMR